MKGEEKELEWKGVDANFREFNVRVFASEKDDKESEEQEGSNVEKTWMEKRGRGCFTSYVVTYSVIETPLPKIKQKDRWGKEEGRCEREEAEWRGIGKGGKHSVR